MKKNIFLRIVIVQAIGVNHNEFIGEWGWRGRPLEHGGTINTLCSVRVEDENNIHNRR